MTGSQFECFLCFKYIAMINRVRKCSQKNYKKKKHTEEVKLDLKPCSGNTRETKWPEFRALGDNEHLNTLCGVNQCRQVPGRQRRQTVGPLCPRKEADRWHSSAFPTTKPWRNLRAWACGVTCTEDPTEVGGGLRSGFHRKRRSAKTLQDRGPWGVP